MPYDRIHAAERARYYDLDPHNFARIIQGVREPDTPENNVYTRARCYMQTWLTEEVMIRDVRPMLYVLEQNFVTPDGTEYTRRGFTAALELTRFDEGVILPHERTLSGPKVDRLNLTRVTEAAWGHIFILYPDAENKINELLQPYLNSHMPAILHEQVIEPDVEQRFWVVDDADVAAAVMDEMGPKRNLIIADGHHRYETALAYRDEMREQHPDAPPNAAFNYVMATFVSMSDPGLVILPTHRLIHSYEKMSGAEVLDAVKPYFKVNEVAGRAEMERMLNEAQPKHPRYGFYDGDYAVLTLKSLDTMEQLVPDRDASWRALDVAVLHEVILEHVMGLTKESVAKKENLDYLRDAASGYDAVDAGGANFLFLLNGTRMEHVRACTRAGEKMPQKSTDFYPKIISGMVALPLHDEIA
jgi:uncharacterized protein (DUF1015 family)